LGQSGFLIGWKLSEGCSATVVAKRNAVTLHAQYIARDKIVFCPRPVRGGGKTVRRN